MSSKTRQLINTAVINKGILSIRAANNNINASFTTMRASVNNILNNWQGSSGDQARSVLHGIMQLGEPRSQVLQNYIRMLEQQVTPGYQQAETVNTILADKFN